jgi:hypothetical protein
MVKEIMYHSRELICKLDNDFAVTTNPTHTVRFKKYDEENLLFTFASPHLKLDSFCKKYGNKLTSDRMKELENKLNDPDMSIFTTMMDLKEYFPKKVVRTLHYYTKKAINYYKMNTTKVNLIFLFNVKDDEKTFPMSIEIEV